MQMEGPVSMSLHASAGEQRASPLRPISLLRTEGTAVQVNSDASTILLVHSGAPSRRSFQAALKGPGHRLLEANSAGQALQLIHSQRVDLVVVALRADTDGVALCRAIRACVGNALLPVITIGQRGQVEDE